MTKEIKIGTGGSAETAKGFVDAWKRVEGGGEEGSEYWLHFENLETLLKTLTPARWRLLRSLRTNGPMSVRALAVGLGRDYKNVHTDVRKLERIGLISRTRYDKIEVPWEIVEARLSLAA